MSNNIIDKIQLSGVTYTIGGQGGSGVSVVEVTQAEYDALPSSAKTDTSKMYVITDAEAGDLTNYYTKTETNSAITQAVSGKQDTLVSGTNIKTINNESLLGSGNIDIQGGGGGGKAVEAGRGISVASGDSAYTVSFNLPISAGTGTNSLILGYYYNSGQSMWNSKATANGALACGVGCSATSSNAVAIGYRNKAEGSTSVNGNFAQGYGTTASGNRCHSEGLSTSATSDASHSEGCNTVASGNYSHSEGEEVKATNVAEHSQGRYNVSNKANNTWGDSGNTLFAVGNGTADNARHNAFEIRQNGDIYLTKDGQDVKLQDQLGGSSINVVQTTGTSTTDVMSQNAVSTKLSGYVTTDTDQVVTSRKTFTNSDKAIEFKQVDDNSKVGFKVKNSASTANELAAFELRPNTFTIDGVQHPLMYFGHYRNINTANAGVPQTVIGFRQYDQKNAAAYHYLIPLPEKAKTPFNLTTSFKDYYAPMGFKNGSTMITADNTGVVDLSSELGGLKLKKLTQAEYDALATKDSNTLYVIVN